MTTLTPQQQLQLMAKVFADPQMPIKKLNTLYALRQSWAAKQKLNDREERMLCETFPMVDVEDVTKVTTEEITKVTTAQQTKLKR